MSNWHQNPAPGTYWIGHAGDVLTLTLFSSQPSPGSAWLRTNLGRARLRRREVIEHVERRSPVLARDWHDVPMSPSGTPGVFEIRLPLCETGRFEAKAFFLPDGETTPVWPEGGNLIVKIEPAASCAGNSIYTAFVRQFGPNMRNTQSLPLSPETLAALEERGCAMIAQSGTFRALAARLDHIVGTLGFRILQLLPIHPVPTTYARMGPFGSPFAAIDYLDVDPALAEFDRKSTPMEQFAELVDGVHRRGASLFLDIPINHTGWASHLQQHHPEWFVRDGNRTFASPGAWGVVWEDLSELDYRHRALWEYMAAVFRFWCAKGVDGFRCDAGYMIPLPVWEYIVAVVRQSYPDTVFLLEGLGGKISVMEDLLDRANLNWAYSELFQIDDREQLERELRRDHAISRSRGLLVHFAETHDNNRLAAVSPRYARMRTALAALCSEQGAFGITNGVEWFATAKLDVHGAPPLNWDHPENQLDGIARLNALLRTHPAFQAGTRLHVLPGNGSALVLRREPEQAPPVLALVNLDPDHSSDAQWPDGIVPVTDGSVFDLLSETLVPLAPPSSPGTCRLTLAAGEARLLGHPFDPAAEPGCPAVARKRMRALALMLYASRNDVSLGPDADPDALADALAADPLAFCEALDTQGGALAMLTGWQWPSDLRRSVMLPVGHALLVQAPFPFRAALRRQGQDGAGMAVQSLPRAAGQGHFAVLTGDAADRDSDEEPLALALTVFDPEQTRHAEAPILKLPPRPRPVAMRFGRESLRDSRRCALLANGAGAMSLVRLEWGRIVSQYDAMLAANPDPHVPVNRRILFSRCRAWLVHMGYSYELGLDCTVQAGVSPGESVYWRFDVPAGFGKSVPIVLTLRLCRHRNRITLDVLRPMAGRDVRHLADDLPVNLILRPDLEDRDFHETSKAYSGPEYQWPSAISPVADGFSFSGPGRAPMRVMLPGSAFVPEPEWHYGIPHPYEADRGLENSGDLFSPGFFRLALRGGDHRQLSAGIEGEDGEADGAAPVSDRPPPAHVPLQAVLKAAIRDFVVRRDASLTVIAGYPWFLDWGRDTLIGLRGIVAMGMLDEASDILLQVAGFEDRGTLPNMIRGNDDRNRDTSDAPLWFFVACRDLLEASGEDRFLEADCRGRTLREVLRSLVLHMIEGTPNGIRMDAESALVFSPAHFSWMDTNYPAGTPREGYPVEIQALWHAALTFLARVDNKDASRWEALALRVRESMAARYWLPDDGYLADCLHAQPGTPAARAVADNALRPNQLLAITLGAVTDRTRIRALLQACGRLLAPGAIRSLADQPVSPPLPVAGPGGLLNDPLHPYWGEYRGDEDTRRKPAYHNGTAWGWLFPSYSEALAMLDPALVPAARSLLYSLVPLLETGCVGHLPEIVDGDRPHTQRGCWAQAWSVTEAARVLKKLDAMAPEASG